MAREQRSSALQGRRVLVIEDEYFLADDLARMLGALGAEVVGPVGEVESALTLCNEAKPLHMAVLDINLHSEMIYPVARKLRASAVPFVFVSGYDGESVPDEFSDVVLLRKPFEDWALLKTLAQLTPA